MHIQAEDEVTERLECALDHVEDYLRSVKAMAARDIREPGRKQKHKAESRLQATVTRHFRKQRATIAARLEAFPPQQKALYQYDFDDLLGDDEDWLPSITRLLLQFVADGIELSAPTMGIAIDYTLTNQAAAAWARKYAAKLVKDIDATTLDIVRSAVSDFIDTPGMSLRDIMDRLPFGDARAEMIAVTEVTRSYAESNAIAGKQVAREFPDVDVVKVVFTNNDDRVCPVCFPFNAVEIPIGEQFHSDESGEDYDGPPFHVSCRCWTQVRTRVNG